MHDDDDLQLRGYQDDLDTDPSKVDEITHEATDEPYNRGYIRGSSPQLYSADDDTDESDDPDEDLEGEDQNDPNDHSN